MVRMAQVLTVLQERKHAEGKVQERTKKESGQYRTLAEISLKSTNIILLGYPSLISDEVIAHTFQNVPYQENFKTIDLQHKSFQWHPSLIPLYQSIHQAGRQGDAKA